MGKIFNAQWWTVAWSTLTPRSASFPQGSAGSRGSLRTSAHDLQGEVQPLDHPAKGGVSQLVLKRGNAGFSTLGLLRHNRPPWISIVLSTIRMYTSWACGFTAAACRWKSLPWSALQAA